MQVPEEKSHKSVLLRASGERLRTLYGYKSSEGRMHTSFLYVQTILRNIPPQSSFNDFFFIEISEVNCCSDTTVLICNFKEWLPLNL